jgi:hypothetical protein
VYRGNNTIQPFQRLLSCGDKPLKRLSIPAASKHRAEAAVLMRGIRQVQNIQAKCIPCPYIDVARGFSRNQKHLVELFKGAIACKGISLVDVFGL